MSKIVKQIVEINNLGIVRYLLMEIKPNQKNTILYKWQEKIFTKIDQNYLPTAGELVKFNDFLANEINRAKSIIPTFESYFDSEISLIIPNDLQTIEFGVRQLNLYPTENGKYLINANLLKGFKEENLEVLKNQFKTEMITNFNFTQLEINGEIFKLTGRLKDQEISSSNIIVQYRVNKIPKKIADLLIGTINNLKLKVGYIWSNQDLLDFKLSYEKFLKNSKINSQQKVMLYDWREKELWISSDYLRKDKLIKLEIGTNNLYQNVGRRLKLDRSQTELIKKYYTRLLDFSDNTYDQMTVLKLKSIQKNELNLFKVRELKTFLVDAFEETLKEIRDELYFQHGIMDIDLSDKIHVGMINQIPNFKKILLQESYNFEHHLLKDFIYDPKLELSINGLYHSNFANLIMMGEWMKAKEEKNLAEQVILQTKIEELVSIPNHYIPANYTTQYNRVAYNKQKYPTFNEKVDKN